MNRLRSTLFVLFVAASIVPLQVTASAQESSDVETATAKLRELQQERVDVLQTAVKLALAQYRQGALDFKTVHAIQHELLDAKLDMAETREERIRVLSSQLKTAEGGLMIAEARFQAAQTISLDVHQAKSAGLRIKIQLLKLRQAEATEKPK
jgi:outer membrane protein TolC